MSCTDVQTIQAGNGTKTQFSFDFPYIFKSEIHVYFWNATTKEYDEKLTTDATYPWRITDANPTIVEFTGTAPPAPATPVDPGETTVDNVKIRRITQVDDIRALFNPGSAIRSDDLNKNFEQLRYAIQEANCQGIPDDVDQYLKDYYWDRFDNTLYEADTWRSDDATIATTAALDQRFQDEVNETFTKAELAAASDVMPDNDDAVPTTGAVKDFVDHVVETDILVDGTGLNKTGSGGQVTLGISADSVDFDRIKDADKIQLADQIADYDNAGSNDKVFTSSAAVRRFENYVQTTTPSSSGIGKGAVWVDNDDDLTLSVWDGSAWLGITSGGTFTNQPKVVYVDASSGNDANDGHRISRPKASIKAAINQINLDSTYGDGSVVVVAAGVYQEAAPIQIQKKNVSIVGQALRSCIVHPTPATETNVLFELNSGSFIQNLTLTGMKAGTGTGNTLDPDLPTVQGWNFAFYNGATITKSPYIQNCTNFSDSEINNSDLNAIDPAGGAGGDTDSAPTGGGMLIDGSAVASDSPLRSMVADSYTHVGLNGPGILVTNNGYCQATSSYAFFNKYHIKCLNGGQANLAASTTDFGEEALVADGKSTTAIFTSNVDGAATDGDISFNINEPVAHSSWHGSATRPQSNMLVEVNGNIYPVLSAVANTDSEGGAGWTVTISRPNTNNRSINDGIDGDISDDASVSFYLRSMIASSGHTMEYVGSGTDYSALPENGGVPDDTKQIVESNNGKVWTATTDHNGKFSVGDFFQADQRTGFVSFSAGSVAFDLATDSTPQLGGDLDTNNFDINLAAGTEGAPSLTFSGDEDTGMYSPAANEVALATNGTGKLFVIENGNVGINTSTPQRELHIVKDGGDCDVRIESTGAGNDARIDLISNSTGVTQIRLGDEDLANAGAITYDHSNNSLELRVNGSTRATIDNGGRFLIGTTTSHVVGSNQQALQVRGTGTNDSRIQLLRESNDNGGGGIHIAKARGTSFEALNDDDQIGIIAFNAADGTDLTHQAANIQCFADGASSSNSVPGKLVFRCTGDGATSPITRMAITREGYVVIGSQLESEIYNDQTNTKLQIVSTTGGFIALGRNDASVIGGNPMGGLRFLANDPSGYNEVARIVCDADAAHDTDDYPTRLEFYTTAINGNEPIERLRIDSEGRMGVGITPSSAASIANVDAGLIQTDGNIDIRYPGTNSDPAGARYLSFINTDSTLVAGQPMGGIRWVGNDSNNPSADTASILAYCQSGTGATSNITFNNGGVERMRIDSSGRLLVGISASQNVGFAHAVQIEGTDGATSSQSLIRNSNDTNGPHIDFAKTRGTATGSNTVVQSGDDLGNLVFRGADGTDKASIAVQIQGQVDGTPGSNDMPGRLVIKTTAEGDSSPTERMRITSSGNLIQYSTGTLERQHRQQASSSYTATNIRSVIDGAAGYLAFDTGTNWTNGNATERMRIDRSGRVLIGVTADTGSQPDRRETLQLTHNNGARIIVARSSTTAGDKNTIGIVHFRSNGGGTYHDSAQILVAADGAHSATDKASDMIFKTTKNNETATTEALRIRSNGRLELPAGTLGISFEGETGSTLKAYEEGIFTPVVADAATGGNTATYDNDGQKGRYTRIGNYVTIVVQLKGINTTGMTGNNNIIIRGLPYGAPNTSGYTAFWTGSLVIDDGFTLTASEFQPIITIADSHDYARIMIPNNTGDRSNADVAHITSGATDFRFSLTYEVDD